MKNHNSRRDTFQFFLLFILIFFLVYSFSNAELNPVPGDEEYAAFAEEMPAPVGGMPAIIKLITYPPAARNAKIEGKVFVLVYLNDNGGVDDVKVLKGLGGGCDEAAIDAVKKSKFTPGKNGGVNVKVKLSLTIAFKIN